MILALRPFLRLILLIGLLMGYLMSDFVAGAIDHHETLPTQTLTWHDHASEVASAFQQPISAHHGCIEMCELGGSHHCLLCLSLIEYRASIYLEYPTNHTIISDRFNLNDGIYTLELPPPINALLI